MGAGSKESVRGACRDYLHPKIINLRSAVNCSLSSVIVLRLQLYLQAIYTRLCRAGQLLQYLFDWTKTFERDDIWFIYPAGWFIFECQYHMAEISHQMNRVFFFAVDAVMGWLLYMCAHYNIMQLWLFTCVISRCSFLVLSASEDYILVAAKSCRHYS